MKATRGPWIYDIHEHSFYIFTKAEMEMVADGDPDHPALARMRGVGRGCDVEEQEANAQLIAASPELREQLLAAKAWIIQTSFRTQGMDRELSTLLENINAVLLKCGGLE